MPESRSRRGALVERAAEVLAGNTHMDDDLCRKSDDNGGCVGREACLIPGQL
jgi:hypothetical protein